MTCRQPSEESQQEIVGIATFFFNWPMCPKAVFCSNSNTWKAVGAKITSTCYSDVLAAEFAPVAVFFSSQASSFITKPVLSWLENLHAPRSATAHLAFAAGYLMAKGTRRTRERRRSHAQQPLKRGSRSYLDEKIFDGRPGTLLPKSCQH